jgi:hypothetical protein
LLFYREANETDLPKPPKLAPSTQDDPFSVFETVTSTPLDPSSDLFSNPLDEFTRSASAAGPAKVDSSPTADNLFPENPNSFESGSSNNGREKSDDLNGSFREKDYPKVSARDTSPMGSFHKQATNERSPLDDFDMPRGRTGHRSMGSDSFSRNKSLVEDPSPESSENSEIGEDVWLTVSEIPLFTRPTSAPPPLRPPPPLAVKQKPGHNHSFNKVSSPVDDLEDFAMGRAHPQNIEYDGGEMESSSAAMKDAMNKAEAKFRHVKEVREKMSKEAELQDREDAEKEREEREKEYKEKERRRIERQEEEKRRKEREERERARLAVERATREARERAAHEARLRAERVAVLRVQQEARERAAAGARERAVSEAREKAEREAREKAAAEAAAERERVEREARDKAAAERMEKEKAENDRKRRDRVAAERAAVERASAEARERLAKSARERHQQQAQPQQRKPDPVPQRRQDPPQKAPEDDLESFFGSRANSAPRPARSPASDVSELRCLALSLGS